jgi:hypothetical protein
MVFALMAGFVVIITMSAARSSMTPLLGVSTAAAGSQTIAAGSTGAHQPGRPDAGSPVIRAASPQLNASLAAAMRTVLRTHPGRVAVGVIDEATGRAALYGPTQPFDSGRLVTADILAALLVRQHASTSVTGEQAILATAMMDNGSAPAAASLWRAIGEANGLTSANRLLKLTQTIPGAGDRWDQTRTTIADQLQLLIDLTSSRSPLTAAGRDYLLDLMPGPGSRPVWGVRAAGTGDAVQDGSLYDGKLWAANSIGIVVQGGRVLLVAVLSSGSTSQAAGSSLASAAAVAAANVMTGPQAGQTGR